MIMATKRKYKVKRYNGEFGSDVTLANESSDPIGELNKLRKWTDTEESPAAPEKKLSFKEAFASARKSGDKTFEWEGKKYTTELASEKKSAPKPSVDTGDDAARKAAMRPKAAAAYETPYDRMNRQNREAAAARKSEKDSERAILRENVRSGTSGRTNPKTLLPMKKGGMVKSSSASKRADGIAQRGKTRGRMM